MALPTSFLAATPRLRGGEDSSPLLLRSLPREEDVGDEAPGACGPMGITPVKIRFEAARASKVRPRVRQR